MKKIIVGLLGLLVIVSLSGGAAYAVFSEKVQITGAVLGTSTPDLEIGESLTGTLHWHENFSLGDRFAKLLPGEYDWGEFYLRNTSNGTTDKLDFNLSAKLQSAEGAWSELSNAVQMRICWYSDTLDNHCDTEHATDFYTLNSWYSAERALPGVLTQGSQQHYAIVFYVPSSFGNEIAGKSITNTVFTFTGTQKL